MWRQHVPRCTDLRPPSQHCSLLLVEVNVPACDDEVRTRLARQVCGLLGLAVDAVERIPLVFAVLLIVHVAASDGGVHSQEVPARNPMPQLCWLHAKGLRACFSLRARSLACLTSPAQRLRSLGRAGP